MKKSIKIFLIITGLLLITVLAFFTYYLIVTANVRIDENNLVNVNESIEIYDKNDNLLVEYSNGNATTSIDNIPLHVQNAFISIEDKRFYSHNGLDTKGILRALVNNVRSFSLKEGASTITQQLIKNTHLSNEKTLNRKLKEAKLSLMIEKRYSKKEILEMYLNTIYFGQGCYGIKKASDFYFNKETIDLDVNEGAILASIIKAPSLYSPTNNPDRCFTRKNVVLREMYREKYISESQYKSNSKKQIVLSENSSKFDNISLLKNQLEDYKNDLYNQKIKVYTTFDSKLQELTDKNVVQNDEYNNSIVILNKQNQVLAYSSNCPLQKRQVGSTIKPLLVYAPAIEENIVYSCTKIDDSKISFGDYSPSNYNDKYYGNISVKDALKNSSNTVTVKLLNELGVDTAKKYIDKTALKLSEKDDSLTIGLGGTYNGYSIIDLASSYQVFLNNGFFNKCYSVNTVSDNNFKIYQNTTFSSKVFSDGTVSVMNDILRETTKSGTARKLNELGLNVYGKTGTVGNENGNTDAYSVIYTNDIIIGVWVGNKQNGYLNNNVTGGSTPTEIVKNILKEIYENHKPDEIENKDTIKLEIDKYDYENGSVKKAKEGTPKRYTEEFVFSKNNYPIEVSKTFDEPKIEIPNLQVNYNQILISLCVPQCYEIIIYKEENGIKKEVYDSLNNDKTSFIDNDIEFDTEYQYSVVPYCIFNESKTFGSEIYLPKAVCSLNENLIE